MLALLLREPFCGPMTPALFADLSDWIILRCYFAPRDRRGRLIVKGRRLSRRERMQRNFRRAARQLPSPETLGIPQKVINSQTYFLAPVWVCTYYSVWRERGLSAEEVTQKFIAEGHLKGA